MKIGDLLQCGVGCLECHGIPNELWSHGLMSNTKKVYVKGQKGKDMKKGR